MAKKNKVAKTNAMRIIEQQGIAYQEYSFPWDEGHLGTDAVHEKLGIAEERIFKTLVAIGKQTGIIVAVIPGTAHLDLKKLAQVSGNKKIDLLPLKDLEATTGYVRGGCSPIGMKKRFPVYLAQEAQQFAQVVLSAGRRGQQVALAPTDLIALTQAKVVDVTTTEASAE